MTNQEREVIDNLSILREEATTGLLRNKSLEVDLTKDEMIDEKEYQGIRTRDLEKIREESLKEEKRIFEESYIEEL